LAEKLDKTGFERLSGEARLVVVMALLALTLIGLFLIVLAMLGGHWVRRLARQRPRTSVEHGRGADAADLELRQSLQSFLPEAKTDDTIQFGKSSPDTKVSG
jgi:hypothetical protein